MATTMSSAPPSRTPRLATASVAHAAAGCMRTVDAGRGRLAHRSTRPSAARAGTIATAGHGQADAGAAQSVADRPLELRESARRRERDERARQPRERAGDQDRSPPAAPRAVRGTRRQHRAEQQPDRHAGQRHGGHAADHRRERGRLQPRRPGRRAPAIPGRPAAPRPSSDTPARATNQPRAGSPREIERVTSQPARPSARSVASASAAMPLPDHDGSAEADGQAPERDRRRSTPAGARRARRRRRRRPAAPAAGS